MHSGTKSETKAKPNFRSLLRKRRRAARSQVRARRDMWSRDLPRGKPDPMEKPDGKEKKKASMQRQPKELRLLRLLLLCCHQRSARGEVPSQPLRLGFIVA